MDGYAFRYFWRKTARQSTIALPFEQDPAMGKDFVPCFPNPDFTNKLCDYHRLSANDKKHSEQKFFIMKRLDNMILFHCVLCAFAVPKFIKKITAKTQSTQSLFGLLKVGGNQNKLCLQATKSFDQQVWFTLSKKKNITAWYYNYFKPPDLEIIYHETIPPFASRNGAHGQVQKAFALRSVEPALSA